MHINNGYSTVDAYGRMGMGSTIDAHGRMGGKSMKTSPDGQQTDRAAARFEFPENTRGQVRTPAAASQNSRDTVTIGSYLRIETTVTYRARLNISAAPAAAPVEETAEAAETAAATDRGANSTAVKDAVENNMNWIQNAAREKDGLPGFYVFDGGTGGLSELKLMSPKFLEERRNCGPRFFAITEETVSPSVLMEQRQAEFIAEHGSYTKAKEFLWNKGFMEWLGSALEKRGIALEDNETFGISVDKYCKVTVTGNNKEKAAAIEKAFNSTSDGENWGLILNKNSIRNKDDFTPQVFKMLMSNYLEEASGGAVTLDDLYVKDGKIMGLPPELDKIINSIEADPYYDIKRIISENPRPWLQSSPAERLQEFIDDHPNQKSYDIKNVLAELLTTGVKNIPDLTANVVIGKGSIAWG